MAFYICSYGIIDCSHCKPFEVEEVEQALAAGKRSGHLEVVVGSETPLLSEMLA